MKTVEISISDWKELISQGKNIPVTIQLHGTSMEPLIRGWRDSVTIVPVTEELQTGDIVLFQRKDGSYVVHRFYQIKGEWIQTWGDNCRFPDEPVPAESVLGIVCLVIKNGNTIWLNNDEQRQKGIRWMNSRFRRKMWFFYRFWKDQAGRVLRKLKRIEQRIVNE